ncbi:zinc ribbon domain-containing protein [Mesorhizobium sp. M0040]|uniref:zinc ribbon domain-containing protein n=1 Tax=Mesorhizobium sp. M0040 TaxID=2956855 RepID=UPI00333ABA97
MVRGPVRKGEALLAGLLRCGHCGRRLLVSYNGTKGDVGRYKCDATRSNPGGDPCISSAHCASMKRGWRDRAVAAAARR